MTRNVKMFHPSDKKNSITVLVGNLKYMESIGWKKFKTETKKGAK